MERVNATRTDPLDLSAPCPHCGERLESHCERRECRLYFRWHLVKPNGDVLFLMPEFQPCR